MTPGSSDSEYDDEYENGRDEEVFQEEKVKRDSPSFFRKVKKKFKSSKSSEALEEDDEIEESRSEWKERVKQADREGSIYIPKFWPHYDGPKVSIAVLDFEDGISQTPITQGLMDKDSFLQVFFGFGEGIANMLVSTLHNTSRFDIMEKKIAKRIFEMYSTDAAKNIYASGKINSPKVPGIRYFVLGSITDITDTSGNEGGVKVKWIDLGKNRSVTSVTLHMRIIDSSTGMVVYSKRLEGTIVESGEGVSLSFLDYGVSGSQFEKTQLGNAIQKILDQCADDIIYVTCN